MQASTSFTSQKINPTTFLIIEDDSFNEHPHIYIKVYPFVILITDTGCNSPRIPNLSVTYLRQYIETYPIPSNQNQPLNPGSKKAYIIILSHCHYDHILGIEQFNGPDTMIIASGNSKSFIQENLEEHSLCKYLNIPTPLYKVTHWARNLEYFSYRDKAKGEEDIPLRIQFFHVPGHTPDSLAWYDLDEHHLYVGDTFYAQYRTYPSPSISKPAKIPIIFPPSGNWLHYAESLALLAEFVFRQNEVLRQYHRTSSNSSSNRESHAPRVLVSSGHSTLAADAETMITDVQSFFMRIIGNAVNVVESTMRFGEVFDFWQDDIDGGGGFCVWAPRRLYLEAREKAELLSLVDYGPGY